MSLCGDSFTLQIIGKFCVLLCVFTICSNYQESNIIIAYSAVEVNVNLREPTVMTHCTKLGQPWMQC